MVVVMTLTRDLYKAFPRAELDGCDAIVGDDVLVNSPGIGLRALTPTSRDGTAVETVLMTIERHEIVRIDVADNTLAPSTYEWRREWPIPHNQRPHPIVDGLDQRAVTAR
jgi:hypothetical protein